MTYGKKKYTFKNGYSLQEVLVMEEGICLDPMYDNKYTQASRFVVVNRKGTELSRPMKYDDAKTALLKIAANQ